MSLFDRKRPNIQYHAFAFYRLILSAETSFSIPPLYKGTPCCCMSKYRSNSSVVGILG